MTNSKSFKSRIIKITFLWILVLINLFFMIGCSGSSSNNSEINQNTVPPPKDLQTLVPPPPVVNDEQINKKNFDEIKNGMSLFEVEVLIAGNNELVSSKMSEKGEKVETYRWETPDSSRFIEVTFQADKVIDKKSKGLK